MLARELDGSTVVTELTSHRAVLKRANAHLPVFAHHGNLLAFVTKDSSTTENVISILNIVTQKETQLVRYSNSMEWIDFTADDRRFLTVSRRPGTPREDGTPAEVTHGRWTRDGRFGIERFSAVRRGCAGILTQSPRMVRPLPLLFRVEGSRR
jgi:hypothetical protein